MERSYRRSRRRKNRSKRVHPDRISMRNGNYLFHPRTKGQLEAEDSIGAYLSQQVAQTEDERCAGVQGREQRGRKAGGGREERRKRERRGGMVE